MAIIQIAQQRCRKRRRNKTEMKFVKFLGKGNFGSVDLFSYTKDGGRSTFFNAVKVSSDHQTIGREFRVLSELKGCQGIVQLHKDSLLQQGTHVNGHKVYKMTMEYASAGTLTGFIDMNRILTGKIPDSTIKDFTRMILQGLVSVHSRGYVHCDLKPDNLLLFPRYDEETGSFSYELKISDFGLSLKPGEEESSRWFLDHPFVGTPVYMSPESVHDGTVSPPLDLWSLGCVVLVMYTGKRPWSGVVKNLNDLKGFLAEDKKALEIPDTVPSDARQFLDKCFALKPEDRGTASELLLHPFLIRDDKKMVAAVSVTKPKAKLEDTITTKKPLKVKIVSSKLPQFKRVSAKPLKLNTLPPRSNFLPVHFFF